MNFQQFNLPFTSSSSIQTNGTPQTTANTKFTTATNNGGAQVVGLLSSDDGVTYLRPVETNGFSLNVQGQHQQNVNHQQAQIITLPITIPGAKPGDMQQQTLQIQVVNPHASNNQSIPFSLQQFGQVLLYNQQNEGLQLQVVQSDETSNHLNNNNNDELEEDSNSRENHEMHTTEELMLEKEGFLADHEGQGYPVVVIPNDMILRQVTEVEESTVMKKGKKSKQQQEEVNSSVAEYLSRMQGGGTLPLSLHHFLKFSADTIKREADVESSPLGTPEAGSLLEMTADGDGLIIEDATPGKRKKKYKKKPPKPKKPRPGQVHIATALDGTTLFCCPECNMAYPDKDMLEQHLIGHKIERRFICDICGAGLKRKEHLERHKLGHNPERPFVCSICMKGFKRKEHLNLHFVIHSGEKTEICQECGKGFYRKDHLRKHTRSHLSKRLREEMQAQQAANKLAQAGATNSNNSNSLSSSVQSMLDGSSLLMGAPQSLEVTVTQVGSNDPPTTIVVPVHPPAIPMDEEDSNEQKPLIIPGTNRLILPSNHQQHNLQPNNQPSAASSSNLNDKPAYQAVNDAINNMQQLLAQQQLKQMSKLEQQLSQDVQSSSTGNSNSSGMSKLEQHLTQHTRQQKLLDSLELQLSPNRTKILDSKLLETLQLTSSSNRKLDLMNKMEAEQDELEMEQVRLEEQLSAQQARLEEQLNQQARQKQKLLSQQQARFEQQKLLDQQARLEAQQRIERRLEEHLSDSHLSELSTSQDSLQIDEDLHSQLSTEQTS